MNTAFYLLLFLAAIALISFGTLHYFRSTVPDLPPPSDETQPLSGRYTGSFFKGNYIYAAAMNLAWNELAENIIKAKIQLKTQDRFALVTQEMLNSATFTVQDLDSPSYYVKSGFGQKTVEAINREVKAKFPEKSFSDLDVSLADKDLIAYAYFLKKVEYQVPFTARSTSFLKERVAGFRKDAGNEEQRENIEILHYENDDGFILALRLKDPEDQLFLAKGYEQDLPETVVDDINAAAAKQPEMIGAEDNFQMPTLAFTHHRRYDEMAGKHFANPGFEEYFIGAMFENIAFTIDEKGARVENEAVIQAAQALPPGQIRNFLLDKPFWLVMKRRDSQNPYFILQVVNTEFMKKANN